jgi:hypothetical protein
MGLLAFFFLIRRQVICEIGKRFQVKLETRLYQLGELLDLALKSLN